MSSNDKLVKLLRLAVDSAAAQGESEVAAKMFVAEVRKSKLHWVDVCAIFADVVGVDPPAPAALGIIMSFGKHKGKSLQNVARCDPQYLAWVYENCSRSPTIQQAAGIVLDHFGL